MLFAPGDVEGTGGPVEGGQAGGGQAPGLQGHGEGDGDSGGAAQRGAQGGQGEPHTREYHNSPALAYSCSLAVQ